MLTRKGSMGSSLVATTPVTRFAWKVGRVFAVESAANVWLLAQVLDRVHVAFFECFAKNARFSRCQWESCELLFINSATNQFFRQSKIQGTDLDGKDGLVVPNAWINPMLLGKYKKVVLWPSTPIERRLNPYYSGSLIRSTDDVLVERIRINDRKTIDGHELYGSAVFPYTNQRLHLCWTLGRNADPLKELYFRRELPKEYSGVISMLFPHDEF